MTETPKRANLLGIAIPAAHLLRPEEPTYTESDMKVLTEAALRLGRKEAGDEIAAALRRRGYGPGSPAIEVARRIASQPSPDATSGRTDHEGCVTCEQQSKGYPND